MQKLFRWLRFDIVISKTKVPRLLWTTRCLF